MLGHVQESRRLNGLDTSKIDKEFNLMHLIIRELGIKEEVVREAATQGRQFLKYIEALQDMDKWDKGLPQVPKDMNDWEEMFQDFNNLL